MSSSDEEEVTSVVVVKRPRVIVESSDDDDDDEPPALTMASSSTPHDDEDGDEESVLNWDTLSQDCKDDEDEKDTCRFIQQCRESSKKEQAEEEVEDEAEEDEAEEAEAEEDDDHLILMPLTLKQMYMGCLRTVQHSEHGTMVCVVPPRTPPNRILCGGRVKVVRSDSSETFTVDNHGYLTRPVQVSMVQALCGKGRVTTTTPDDQQCSVVLTKQVAQGDRLVFENAGFLGYRMYGIVHLVPTPLTEHQKTQIWTLLDTSSFT